MRCPKWIFTSLLSLVVSKSCSLVVSSGHSSKRSSCIDLVAQRYFPRKSTVVVIATDFYNYQGPSLFSSKPPESENNLAQLVSVSRQFSLVTLTPDANDTYCSTTFWGRKADYFIFVGEANEVVSYISAFCFDFLTSDQSQFVVYLETETFNVTDMVENALKTFWSHQHQNVLVLVGSQQKDIDVYTWFPLDDTPDVKIVDQCNGQNFSYNNQISPRKIPRNLKGRTIKVGIVVAPISTCQRVGGGYAGTEVEILESMASELNFTTAYSLPWEFAAKNDPRFPPWKGFYSAYERILLGTMLGEVNVALGGFELVPEKIDDFSYTQPYAQDTYTFYVTNDESLSFDTEAWIAVIFLEMIVVQTFTALAIHGLRQKKVRRRQSLGSTAIMVWSLLTDSSVREDSRLSTKQKLLWSVCAFYVIVVNTANKSVLTSRLATPHYIENVQTVTEMIDSKLPFLLTTLENLDEIPNLSPDENKELSKRLVVCPEPLHSCLVKFLTVPEYCLAASAEDLEFIQIIATQSQKYHHLDRTILTLYLSMYTTKNFFLARKMTTMILRSAQAGLVNHWYKKTQRNYNLCDLSDSDWTLLGNSKTDGPASETLSNTLRPYSMTHLYSPFLFLGFGLSLAGVAFVFEAVLTASSTYQSMWTRLWEYCREPVYTLFDRLYYLIN